MATNVMVGAFKGVETVAFYFHANHGDMGYKQTTVAMKSSARIVELSSLWQTSGIRAERIGEWIILFRPKETIEASQIPSFLNDCRNLLGISKITRTSNHRSSTQVDPRGQE